MRQVGLAFVAVTALMALGAPIAEAGVTCKIIPSWCPSDRSHNEDNKNGITGTDTPRTSVPEPGTLMLLAAGVTAVGGAVYRRRKSKKD
ncbi:MAG: hypothetical protein JWN85_3891 [Gammaproteobacteria bacterium]|nr:hypothetical protein [Gammaproteobacteria bacterium]